MNPRSALLLAFMLFMAAGSSAQTWNWTWTRKVGFSGLNDPFCVNPLNPNTIFSSNGSLVLYVSRNKGKTWTAHSAGNGYGAVKAIEINAHDSTMMLIAQEGDGGDRVAKSTNSGATWTTTLATNFYYFGHPLAYEASLDDDVVYTMGNNIMYRSTDFGSTWDSVGSSASFGSANNGWEDALIRPDSNNILYAADNATGIWKSTDYGSTWRRTHQTFGEIPALAMNAQNPAVAYATRWGAGGGLLKSTDFGETWNMVSQFNGLQTWGVAVSTEDPNYVAFGTWGPAFGTTGGIYISRDAGATWDRTWRGFSTMTNHAVFVTDTATVLSVWGDGVWKLPYPGSIAGRVFLDVNGNGAQDSGEIPLQGWKVRLTGSRVDSTLTDADGNYEFTLLGLGTYNAIVDTGSDFAASTPPGGFYQHPIIDNDHFPNSNFGITAPGISVLQTNQGWNLVSLGVVPSDRTTESVFPAATSDAFAYSSTGYVVRDTLEKGEGYWLKFPDSAVVVLGGEPIQQDTLEVSNGWNLIGSVSSAVNVDSVLSDPPGIIVSDFFAFSGGVYTEATHIEPMRSYWVKVNQPGSLILNGGTSFLRGLRQGIFKK